MSRKQVKSKIEKVTNKRIDEIALDFIVNNKTITELQKDYNISKYLASEMVKKLNLIEKREKYKEKVLDKATEKCSDYQAKIIVKSTELLHGHINNLSASQNSEDSKPLTSSEIRDVMAILQIVSKEYRLDNDKPTDRTISSVEVSFPQGFTPITNSPVTVDAEFKNVEEETKEEEPKEEEVIVEIDNDTLENPLG